MTEVAEKVIGEKAVVEKDLKGKGREGIRRGKGNRGRRSGEWR